MGLPPPSPLLLRHALAVLIMVCQVLRLLLPGPPYAARYDLSGDGVIDLSDVLLYNTPGVFGAACEL